MQEAARLNIFSANLERAAELNAIGGAEFGVTKFADLTAQARGCVHACMHAYVPYIRECIESS